MPPKTVRRKDPTRSWPTRLDGTPINPNTLEAMLVKGLVEPPRAGMPWRKPYEATLEPANAQAILAISRREGGGGVDGGDADDEVTLFKPPPAGAVFYRLHAADENYPEALPTLAASCAPDQLEEMLDCMRGLDDAPRWRNPETGLECARPLPSRRAAVGDEAHRHPSRSLALSFRPPPLPPRARQVRVDDAAAGLLRRGRRRVGPQPHARGARGRRRRRRRRREGVRRAGGGERATEGRGDRCSGVGVTQTRPAGHRARRALKRAAFEIEAGAQ